MSTWKYFGEGSEVYFSPSIFIAIAITLSFAHRQGFPIHKNDFDKMNSMIDSKCLQLAYSSFFEKMTNNNLMSSLDYSQ